MRKLMLLGVLGLMVLGLESLLSVPQLSAPQSLSYTDWDRIKDFFH